jgi:hypothetical protein
VQVGDGRGQRGVKLLAAAALAALAALPVLAAGPAGARAYGLLHLLGAEKLQDGLLRALQKLHVQAHPEGEGSEG